MLTFILSLLLMILAMIVAIGLIFYIIVIMLIKICDSDGILSYPCCIFKIKNTGEIINPYNLTEWQIFLKKITFSLDVSNYNTKEEYLEEFYKAFSRLVKDNLIEKKEN